ncbi:hypothetical protein FKW77_010795 [Venturia effusa]|uniref:Uncharacterized protein n=1 Tax=Venturia effusa TaxID=50376 RepID=A0A517KYG2_9PEZI|nr:hypothetical protein FKW77_010795 [Venturia effusa]
MFFSKTVLISVLGLSAFAAAAPLENGVAVEAAPTGACSWYEELLGHDCDDDEEAEVPSQHPSPRPVAPQPARGKPKGSENNNPFASQPQPYPNQPYTNQPYPNQNQPVSSQPIPTQPRPGQSNGVPAPTNPRPANAFQPRPANNPRPITAPKGDGTDKQGQSSWCDRPDPARRPASCGNGGTLGTSGTSAPLNTGSAPGWPTQDWGDLRPVQ